MVTKTDFDWNTEVPLVTNPLILRQLLLVAFGSGAIIAFLLSVIFAATGEFSQIPIVLLISLLVAAGLGIFLILISLLFFGNKVLVRFNLNESGATWITLDRRAKTGNRLAILAGILSGNPQVAGAGLLGASRETEYIGWRQIRKVEYNPKHKMIILRGSFRPLMMLICTAENYDSVSSFVAEKVNFIPDEGRINRPKKPLRKALAYTVAVTLAVAPLFNLSAQLFFDFDLFLPLMIYFFALATVWLVPLLSWVVLVCAAIVGLQLVFIGLDWLPYMYGNELISYLFSWFGLIYLAYFSFGALKGKYLPPLLMD